MCLNFNLERGAEMTQKTLWKTLALALMLALILSACAQPGSNIPSPQPSDQPTESVKEPQPQGDAEPVALQSDKPRDSAPVADPAAQSALTDSNTAFAFDLYRQLVGAGDNLFYSPYSISLALAMTQAGAEGQTLEEMNQALHFDLPKDQLHPAFNALDQGLAQRAAQSIEGEKPFQLHIANSIWGQQDYAFNPSYLDLLAQNYGAGLRLVDFVNATEASRQAINDWVAEQTEDRIKDLIPPGSIDEMTRLVLANAIYFNGGWLNPFEAENTRPETFNALSGEAQQVPMMRQTDQYGYARGDGWQLVELGYVSYSYAMDVIVPDAGNFEAFEQSLTGEQVNEMLSQVFYTTVILGMPKFEYESDFLLKEPLQALGMNLAFQPGQADFTGMAADSNLYIQEAVHKAFVSVDEAGTEAAAATAVMAGTTSMPMEEINLTIDRPFIFLIRDRESGTILFVGRVVSIES
jgi:serpin B